MIQLKLKTINGEKLEEYDDIERLNLTGKSLIKVPNIDRFTKLKEINLIHNSITILPIKIFTLINLTELNLYNNRLKVLPPEIGKLINLNKLNLRSNLLKHLPLEIGALTKLQHLSLTDNQFKYLPDININLIHLWMSNNQLKFLPVFIDIKKNFFLDDNSIIFIYMPRNHPWLFMYPSNNYFIYNDDV